MTRFRLERLFYLGWAETKWQTCAAGGRSSCVSSPPAQRTEAKDGARLSEFYEQEARVDDETTDLLSYEASVLPQPRSCGQACTDA